MDNASTIAAGTAVRGHIHAEGDLEVLGHVEGSVSVDGKLVVGEGATLKSELSARTVVIRGAVAGDIRATESLLLEPDARVVGDLTCPNIGIRPGALVRGHVRTEAATDKGSGEARARTGQTATVARAAAPSRVVAAARAAVPPAARIERPTPPPARRPPAPTMPKASGRAERRPAAPASDQRAGAPAPVVPALGKRTAKAQRRTSGR